MKKFLFYTTYFIPLMILASISIGIAFVCGCVHTYFDWVREGGDADDKA